MGIDRSILDKILESVVSTGNIELSDIPCIDLYMDQVTTLFEDKLADTKRAEKDKVLTKTMVNNYVKSKTMMPPKDKKYGKNHLIALSMIYNLKQVLSIGDIKALLAPVIKGSPEDMNNKLILENLYSTYLDIKKKSENELKDTFDIMLKDIEDRITDSSDNDKVMLILLVADLINQAALNKRMAEKLIDEFF